MTEEGLGEVEVEANMRDRGLIITGSVTADPEHAAQARVESLIHAAAPDFTITKFWIERRL